MVNTFTMTGKIFSSNSVLNSAPVMVSTGLSNRLNTLYIIISKIIYPGWITERCRSVVEVGGSDSTPLILNLFP